MKIRWPKKEGGPLAQLESSRLVRYPSLPSERMRKNLSNPQSEHYFHDIENIQIQLYKEQLDSSELKKSLSEISEYKNKIQFRYKKIMDFITKKQCGKQINMTEKNFALRKQLQQKVYANLSNSSKCMPSFTRPPMAILKNKTHSNKILITGQDNSLELNPTLNQSQTSIQQQSLIQNVQYQNQQTQQNQQNQQVASQLNKSNIDNINEIQISAIDTKKYKDFNPLLTLNLNKISTKIRQKVMNQESMNNSLISNELSLVYDQYVNLKSKQTHSSFYQSRVKYIDLQQKILQAFWETFLDKIQGQQFNSEICEEQQTLLTSNYLQILSEVISAVIVCIHNYEDSEQFAHSLNQINKKTLEYEFNLPILRIYSSILLATVFSQYKQISKAEKFFQISFSLSKNIKDYSSIAFILYEIGKMFALNQQHTKSMKFFIKFLQLAWFLNNYQMELEAYEQIGIVSYYTANIAIAKQFHNRMILGTLEPKNSSLRQLGILKLKHDYDFHEMSSQSSTEKNKKMHIDIFDFSDGQNDFQTILISNFQSSNSQNSIQEIESILKQYSQEFTRHKYNQNQSKDHEFVNMMRKGELLQGQDVHKFPVIERKKVKYKLDVDQSIAKLTELQQNNFTKFFRFQNHYYSHASQNRISYSQNKIKMPFEAQMQNSVQNQSLLDKNNLTQLDSINQSNQYSKFSVENTQTISTILSNFKNCLTQTYQKIDLFSQGRLTFNQDCKPLFEL